MEILGSLMAFLTLGAGAFLTVRTGFFQFTHLRSAVRSPFKRNEARSGGVTPFQAMATALGSSIGTANIAGVAGAILIGGPGAVFWMWMAGLFGMASKLSEIVLALGYRDMSCDPPRGGPMLYIERGLGRRAKPLSCAFAISGCLAGLVGTALVQSNTIAQSALAMAEGLGMTRSAAVKAAAGGLTCLLCGAVILGGARRIGAFSEKAVPFMAALYALACLTAIRWERVIEALLCIFRSAFAPAPAAGGLLGAGFLRAFRVGTARGVYSNEAGVGSGAMAHAGSSETDPVKQGMLGIFEVFADTFVVCSLTALVILTSEVHGQGLSGEEDGMRLAGEAFAAVMGRGPAGIFLSVSVLLFAFTSLVGWSLYGERCAEYLFGRRVRTPFRVLFLLLIPVGALAGAGSVWRLGELFNYLMALPNITALILLSGQVKKELDAYKMFEKSRGRHYNKG